MQAPQTIRGGLHLTRLSRSNRYSFGSYWSILKKKVQTFHGQNYSSISISNSFPINCLSFRLPDYPKSQNEIVQDKIAQYLIPSLKNWTGVHTENRLRQILLILATPKHVALLETQSIQILLNKLMVSASQPIVSEVDVICACVDGLAPTIAELSSEQENHREGISILFGTSIVDSKELLSETSTSAVTSDQKCSLKFHMKYDDNSSPSCEITTPLANTIFINGRRSTLLTSRWKKTGENLQLVQQPSHRFDASINLFITRNGSFFDVPIYPLTVPRKIQSGLGNIVRRLTIDGASAIPASQELEKAVMETHKIKTESRDYNVWALITPPGMVQQQDRITERNPCNLFDGECNYSNMKDLLVGGAKIYRVLSGGGGWGNKEGLLALDPEMSFEGSPVLGTKLSDDDMESPEKYTDALANIAQEGAAIQFFHTINKQRPGISQQGCATDNKIVIGSVYSTVDESVSASVQDREFIAGHFGCVSESGIFFKSAKNISTKIDVPNSYFFGRSSDAATRESARP